MKKRVISMFLAGVLSISFCPIISAAEDSDVSDLILYSKEFFSVGDEFDDFDYTYETAEGETIYTFDWKNTETDQTLSVSINENKYISAYYKSEEDYKGLGTVTKEEAKDFAQAFINKTAPAEYVQNIKFSNIYNRSYSYNPTYTIYYTYEINDIPVLDTDFYCNVSKHTGEITSYTAPQEKALALTVPDPNGFITPEEAAAVYKENSDLSLKYYVKYGDDENTVYAAYRLENCPYGVDAETGEIADEPENDLIASRSTSFDLAETADAEEASGEAKLSAAETASIEDKQGLLTADEALALFEKEVYIADKTNMLSSLSKSYDGGKYYWNIYIDNSEADISLKIDAETGSILYYYNYYAYERALGSNSTDTADYDTMLKTAERLGNAFAGNVIEKTELEYAENKSFTGKIDGYSFGYIRTANGVKFPANGIEIDFSADGTLTGYSFSWNEEYSFPSVSDAIGTDRAYEIMTEISAPELCYVPEGTDGAKAVYLFGLNSVYLDKSGIRITYNGDIYEEKTEFEGYTDISGSKYEDIINLLYNNGYYLERSEFKPQEPISAEDFFDFFRIGYKETDSGVSMRFYNNDKVYSGSLTRYEAAEILAYYKDFGGLLTHPDIFDVSCFKDEIAEEYKAAAAIAYGLDYMTGDQNDCFNGSQALTNEEAAVILYRYLINQ
ncbi:MAG: hypothetical protein LUC92_05690 [Clostridiales bacterium]|nr:hypothetical protein [Clostridiales bacterium]